MARILLQVMYPEAEDFGAFTLSTARVNDTTNGTATVPPEYTPNGTPQDVTPC